MTCTTGNCPPPNTICEAIRKKIDEYINRDKRAAGNGGTHGLVHRFREQINGASGPGTRGWDTHHKAITDQQRGLGKLLKKLEKNFCGPPPPGARNWAERPAPQPSEWVDPNPGITPGGAAKVVAGGAATVGIGYLIYRGIRMIPSLFFPPSIPFNAAIP
ncbi:hypothetical protein [Ascidiaceihabitans sp.]|uniref:hypothetical protein n=1 Tax=Ascidiaceihabitans sp. TaxID=1872644 RepID=UPI00329A4CAF